MAAMLRNMDITRLSLSSVAERCKQESLLYLQQMAYDPRYCYELFRRAIAERNEGAWELLYIQYAVNTPILVRWVERHPSYSLCGEEAPFFVNRALERLWSTVTPERFGSFPDLKSLLRYLQLCIHSAIVDHARSARPATIALDEALDEVLVRAVIQPETAVYDQQALWDVVEARLHDEKERTVMYCRYDLGMKPAEIYEQHQALYSGVKEVYRTLQNVLSRLRRDETVARALDA